MEVLQLTEVPGTGMEVLQKSQKFRVLHGSLTKLSEVPGGYINVVPVPVPAPRYYTKCRVPGIYPGIYPISRVFILQKAGYDYEMLYRVRLWDVVPVPRVL